jgi:hypothetical protein
MRHSFIFATMWAYGGSVGGGQDDNEVLINSTVSSGRSRRLSSLKEGFAMITYYSIEENKWVIGSTRSQIISTYR